MRMNSWGTIIGLSTGMTLNKYSTLEVIDLRTITRIYARLIGEGND